MSQHRFVGCALAALVVVSLSAGESLAQRGRGRGRPAVVVRAPVVVKGPIGARSVVVAKSTVVVSPASPVLFSSVAFLPFRGAGYGPYYGEGLSSIQPFQFAPAPDVFSFQATTSYYNYPFFGALPTSLTPAPPTLVSSPFVYNSVTPIIVHQPYLSPVVYRP